MGIDLEELLVKQSLQNFNLRRKNLLVSSTAEGILQFLCPRATD